MNYWNQCREDDLLYMIIDYLKRIELLYSVNNNKELDIDEVYRVMITCYFVLGEYEKGEEILNAHKTSDFDIYSAYIQIGLKNYDKASEVVSSAYVHSVINILNANVIQVRLAMIKNQVEEAYDISKWGINFIKSVIIREDSFLEVTFILTAYKATIEKYLGLDYSESLKFLKDNYDKLEEVGNDTETIKFYDNKEITSFSIFRNIKERLSKDIEETKESVLYNSMVEIYNLIFE